MTDLYECPHCALLILVAPNEINCGIFRHGVAKGTNEQIPPHLPKEQCEALVARDAIYGCGKPFRIHDSKAVACEYV
jgi:DNA-directed RNA polymerase subunit RPC12/RpoP